MVAQLDESCDVNEVRLVGRVSGEPEVRVMPSGDELLVWRVVVVRSAQGRPVRSDGKVGPRHDVLDCVTWSPRVRRSAQAWRPGDVVEVRGAIRRRFYRAGPATASRVEVEVSGGRVIRRAAT